VDAGGFALRAESSGGARSPAFVCLHGLADTLEIWDGVAPALDHRGTLVRFDQRGHGGSDAPAGPYDREALARDCIAVLDRFGVGRAVLVGHSMGGVVALATALDFPERVERLVLVGTTSRVGEQVAGWYERIARAGEREGLEGIRRAIGGDGSRRPLAGDALGIAGVTRVLADLRADPLTPLLPGIACPALVLVGEKDPMGTKASEELARGLGSASLEVVPGCGHWVHVDAPAAFVASLDAWLCGDPSVLQRGAVP
jgi:pimeloyl-ACP methyl ester carboxylesterase